MGSIIQGYLQELSRWLIDFLPNLVKALVIFFAGWLGSRLVKRLIDRLAQRLKRDTIIWGYIGTVLRYLVMIVLYIFAMKVVGIPVDSLLAAFGISGVIIGLGARQSIANYFAGLMMLSARPFKKGDLIEFGPPPQIGVVKSVKMTYTSLDTLDNVRIVVPNSVIWRNKISNFSIHGERAVNISLGIPYDVDVDYVEDIALNVLRQHEAIQNDPIPRFTISDVTTNDVKALLVAWSRVETMNIFGEVITRMRKEFETAGISVTVPAKDIDLRREE